MGWKKGKKSGKSWKTLSQLSSLYTTANELYKAAEKAREEFHHALEVAADIQSPESLKRSQQIWEDLYEKCMIQPTIWDKKKKYLPVGHPNLPWNSFSFYTAKV